MQENAQENAEAKEKLLQQISAEMVARMTETQRLREAMLQAGISIELIEDPEGAEMDHLDEDEQEQFNDAVREHRVFLREMEHDMRALQLSRDTISAAGVRQGEAALPPAMSEEGKS